MRCCGTFHSHPPKTIMREEFVESIKKNQDLFGIKLTDENSELLAQYYEIVQEHNPLLHLVGPCSAAEFATRHILESLTLLDHLPLNARFGDIGPGGGLPSLPCLIVRDDLGAVLIESKIKKARFLSEATKRLGIGHRVDIIDRQFEEADAGQLSIITCRALDKFTEKLPKLLKWARRRRLLLFGGVALGAALDKDHCKFTQKLMPLSDARFLFIVN